MINLLKRIIISLNYISQVNDSNNLYLIEFPKSGITWLTNILIELHCKSLGIKVKATYFNHELFIPDIHVSYKYNPPKLFNLCHFIKSHESYNPIYRHVIYIIRNPYSVMDSYYRYQTINDKYIGNISEFIRDKRYGIKKWATHVKGWLFEHNHYKLQIIRYEDLLKSPNETINRLLNNTGLNMDESIIAKACTNSSRENMKASANLYSDHCISRKYNFIGTGSSKSIFSSQDLDYIKKHTSSIIGNLYSNDELSQFLREMGK